MKKRTFREWLKAWDEGEIDFSVPGPGCPETPGDAAASGDAADDRPAPKDDAAIRAYARRFRDREAALFRRIYPVMVVLIVAVISVFLLRVVTELPPFGSADTPANSSETIRRYLEDGLSETGAVNVVAGVILDYRAFDTLGESHVLFTAACAVLILLLSSEKQSDSLRVREILEKDAVLHTTGRVLIPLILLFGIYIVLCGHLGPGGGFSGGAVIGSALILYSLCYGPERVRKGLNLKSYRVTVLTALLFYSLAKCYSFFCGANGLETMFGPGTPGNLFSAGLILPLNLAVGTVVACTMYGFYALFTEGTV